MPGIGIDLIWPARRRVNPSAARPVVRRGAAAAERDGIDRFSLGIFAPEPTVTGEPERRHFGDPRPLSTSSATVSGADAD
jgi:hypothetical protein